MEIQEKAIDVDRNRIKIEESLCGSEDFGGKAMGVQQILEASQQAPVVIDDGYSLLLRHEYFGFGSMRAYRTDVNFS